MIFRTSLLLLLLGSSALAAPKASVVFSEKQAMEILGLQPGASEEAIRAAYRRLAKRWHPDSNRDHASAAAKFNELQEAHDVLMGKLALGTRPAGSAGAGSGKANGFRGFQDFGGEDFNGGFRQHTRSGPKERPREAPRDAFMQRFFLYESHGLSPEVKKTLADGVALSQKLFAGGLTSEAIQLQNSLEEATGQDRIARWIFFTMIGEEVQWPGKRRQADLTLKAYFASKTGIGLERALNELVAYEGSTRLKGPKGEWAALFPETTRALLTSPELPTMPSETTRLVLQQFTTEADSARHASFYAGIAKESPLLRDKFLQAKIRELLYPNRQPGAQFSSSEIRRRTDEILREIKGAGRELDGVRWSLYEHLLGMNFSPTDYPGFLEEVRKIEDFSQFDLRRGLSTSIVKGRAEAFAARKAMMAEVLQRVRDKAPEKFAEQRAAFRAFVGPNEKEWAEVMSFLYPMLDEHSKPPPAPRTAEYRQHAERCAEEYSRISKIIGGSP